MANRLRLVLLCTLLPFVIMAWQSREKRPNILLILTDDLGYGDLSGYGARDLQTPHLDSLMRAGLRFTHFYANSPVCSPSRAAMLTGRYPDAVGVPGVIRSTADNSWGYLDPSATLLPQLLKRAGYHTAIVGKWHLGLNPPNRPNDRGFDHFHGHLEDMMDDYVTHLRHGQNWMRLNQKPDDHRNAGRPRHATELFSHWASDYLWSRTGKSAPFFLYLAYNAPHFPVQPPAEWLARVKQRNPSLTEKRAALVALIEHLDDQIGTVLQTLRQTGQADNTLIVFASDNGGLLSTEASNGPLRGGKQQMFEGGIRVPAFVIWPGVVKSGQLTQTGGMLMDVFPTLLEAANVPIPNGLDGRSLMPILRDAGAVLPERDRIWVRREGGSPYFGQDYYAIRRGDWKLLQNTPFEPYQLFNLTDDPGETRNLVAEQPKKVEELSRALQNHIARVGATAWQSQPKP